MTCSCDDAADSGGAPPGFRRALVAVIAINAAIFAVEMTAGSLGGSQALKADALDFLGDSVTYAMSLAVAGMALRWRARAALVKGLTLGALGLWVLAATAYQTLVLGVPDAAVMGGVGALACLANLLSVLILLKYREGDANVRSVWLCSTFMHHYVCVVCMYLGVCAVFSPIIWRFRVHGFGKQAFGIGKPSHRRRRPRQQPAPQPW